MEKHALEVLKNEMEANLQQLKTGTTHYKLINGVNVDVTKDVVEAYQYFLNEINKHIKNE